MPLNPHLVDTMEIIEQNGIEIYQLHNIKVFLAVLANRYFDAISYLLIETIVGIYHVRSCKVFPQVMHDVQQNSFFYLRINTFQGSQQNIRKDAL